MATLLPHPALKPFLRKTEGGFSAALFMPILFVWLTSAWTGLAASTSATNENITNASFGGKADEIINRNITQSLNIVFYTCPENDVFKNITVFMGYVEPTHFKYTPSVLFGIDVLMPEKLILELPWITEYNTQITLTNNGHI